MAKKIEIDVEDDELELLEMMRGTLDFYGQGYDDGSSFGRNTGDIFNDFVEKLKKAMI